MAITDELRLFAADPYTGWVPTDKQQADLRAIADRIDREHRMAMEKVAAEVDEEDRAEPEDAVDWKAEARTWERRCKELIVERDERYIALPLDADGVTIRPGDALVIFETGEHIRAYDIELYDDGRWIVGDEETMDSIHPDRLRHRAQTVEDVLRQFADDVYADSPNVLRDRDAIVERYAAKLRLAEEEK